MYEAGVDNDQFTMIANANKRCEVAVKTPWGGLCEKFLVYEVEMQGSVLAPLRCSLQVDSLGKQFMVDKEMNSQVYKYKNCVSIPPLGMIDDIIAITNCGVNSVKINAAVQSKIDTKRLTLSMDKCVKMHFGTNTHCCPQLKVHDSVMQSSRSQTYLGDIYSVDFKIDENTQKRYEKGIGIVNNIVSITKHISFGFHTFEIAMILRSSLLLNGILYNLETLFNLKQKHVELLEKCDKYFWQAIFNAPKSTPIEAFFIESSSMPIRFILMGKRVMFLWTLLNKNDNELAKMVFLAQRNIPTKNSWVENVKCDLLKLKKDLSFEQIASLTKGQFEEIVSNRLRTISNEYSLNLH